MSKLYNDFAFSEGYCLLSEHIYDSEAFMKANDEALKDITHWAWLHNVDVKCCSLPDGTCYLSYYFADSNREKIAAWEGEFRGKIKSYFPSAKIFEHSCPTVLIDSVWWNGV